MSIRIVWRGLLVLLLDAFSLRAPGGFDLFACPRDPYAFAKVTPAAVCRLLEVACQSTNGPRSAPALIERRRVKDPCCTALSPGLWWSSLLYFYDLKEQELERHPMASGRPERI